MPPSYLIPLANANPLAPCALKGLDGQGLYAAGHHGQHLARSAKPFKFPAYPVPLVLRVRFPGPRDAQYDLRARHDMMVACMVCELRGL